MKILFLIPYPLQEVPSQRFRFEQYFKFLTEHDFTFEVHSFFLPGDWRFFYNSGKTLKKSMIILIGLLRRSLLLFHIHQFHVVFIHREATPIGPPALEWIIGKVFRKRIVYDFDDAIWMTDKMNESFFEKLIRWRSKVASICKWSYKVSCGNTFLMQYAIQFNGNAVLNPTTIDTENLHNPFLYKTQKPNNRIVIGWTGSHSTLKYLYHLERVLHQTQNKFPEVDFMVIADKEPTIKLERLIFKPWSKESEIQDLMLADIGIMPLPDDEWAKGKCGFKALQYMALEIPSVVSPVGINREIIFNEVNGFLCSKEEEWLTTLERLILSTSLRKSIGRAGRQTVIERYAVTSNSDRFLSLFE
jgi:glycosyltransferase involved in cell wall biosynthesis